MNQHELCGSCGKPVDSTVDGFEVVLRVGVAVVFKREPLEGTELTDRIYNICAACALSGRVPYFDGAVFSEVLRAAKKQSGD